MNPTAYILAVYFTFASNYVIIKKDLAYFVKFWSESEKPRNYDLMKKLLLILLLIAIFACGCVRSQTNETESSTEYVTGDAGTEDSSEQSKEQSNDTPPSDSESDDELPTQPPESESSGSETESALDTKPKEESEFVRTPSDVTVDMYEADFWIKD